MAYHAQVQTPVNWVFGEVMYVDPAMPDAEVDRRFPAGTVTKKDMCGVPWRGVGSVPALEHPFIRPAIP